MKFQLKKIKQMCQKLWCWLLRHHLLAAIFWACLVYIGHHKAPLIFDAPDQLAYFFTQKWLTDPKDDGAPKQGLVALISDQNFYGAPYYGEEPTQRCAVLESLQEIVVFEPKALVIDLNLSPTYRDLLTSSKATDSAICQKRLEQFLISTAIKTQVLLIDPMQFPVDSATTLERRLMWRRSLESKGLHFGHADIQHSLLSSLTHFAFTPDKAGGEKRSEYKIEAGMSYRLCQLLACNNNLERDLPLKAGEHLINYAAFVKNFDTKWIGSNLTESINTKDVKNKIVYFGFGTHKQDQRVTPIGLQYGVEIHAAYYASLQEPIKTYGLIDILGDILIGMAIAFWGNKLVEKIMSIKKKELESEQKILSGRVTVRYAYWAVVGLIILTAFVATLVVFMSYLLLASPLRVWTSPLVMIFAMCLDVFCRVPFEHLLPHPASHECTIKKRVIDDSSVSVGKQVSTVLWHCVAFGVPIYAVCLLLCSPH